MQNGKLIANLRTLKCLSQNDIARMLQVSLSVYKQYEEEKRPMSIDDLNTISNFFKVSFNTLLNLTSEKTFYGESEIDYKYMRFSLRYFRRINRITQKELGKALKVSLPMIARYEKHPECIKADYLYVFARYFHISADYICGKTKKKEVL